MDTISMNSENRKTTSEPYRLLLNLADECLICCFIRS